MVVCHKSGFLLVFALICGAAFGQSKKDSVWIKTRDGCKVYNPNPKKDETISWTGACVSGYADGEGTLVWYKNDRPNQTYTGTMKKGSPHGHGKYDYGSGSVYEGDYILGREDGIGKVIYSNRQGVYYTYEGAFRNGDFEGIGTEIYYKKAGDTSSMYKGGFLKNERHGHGTVKEFNWRGFAVTEGSFEKGKLQDDTAEIRDYREGLLLAYYKGGYRDYGRNGYGEEVMGLNKYEGQWQNDKKHGVGKLIHDGVVVYDGEWQDNQFDGIGKRVFLDGSEYIGQFNKNERHGYGVMRWKDGAQYVGEFKKDLFSGKGYTIYQNNQLNVSGVWEMGRFTMDLNVVNIRKELQAKYKDVIQRLKTN